MATQIEEIKNYFKDLYKRSVIFIKNNKIELSTLFVVLFLLFTINETNQYCITKQNGGLPGNPQAQQQAQMQAQKQAQQKALEEQKKKRDIVDRTKMELASSFSNKFINLAQNNKTLNNIICYISSFFKSSIALFSIVFAVMLIPGIPVFGFMLILFAILRTKVSNIKAL
jgi:hypothetical protein